jgi:GNAT superfamily N-acetyltransferase
MLSIRRMLPEDITASHGLLSQLGYEMDVQEVRQRYDAVVQSEDHAVIVAEQDGYIVAFCHIYARPALDKPPEAVVQAMVVDHACRSGGVGKTMMAAAETWAAERGFRSVALASHVSRFEAHAFYKALGYQPAATSYLFRKALG